MSRRAVSLGARGWIMIGSTRSRVGRETAVSPTLSLFDHQEEPCFPPLPRVPPPSPSCCLGELSIASPTFMKPYQGSRAATHASLLVQLVTVSRPASLCFETDITSSGSHFRSFRPRRHHINKPVKQASTSYRPIPIKIHEGSSRGIQPQRSRPPPRLVIN